VRVALRVSAYWTSDCRRARPHAGTASGSKAYREDRGSELPPRTESHEGASRRTGQAVSKSHLRVCRAVETRTGTRRYVARTSPLDTESAPDLETAWRQGSVDAMRTTWWCNPCSLAQPRIEPITSILNASVTNRKRLAFQV